MKKGILFVVALIICVFIPTFFLAKASSGLYIASKECPQAYVDYAEENVSRFVLGTGDEMDVTTVSVGTPFSFAQSDANIFYFPVLCDGVISYLLRVYPNGTGGYDAVISSFLAEELEALSSLTSAEHPMQLRMENSSIVAEIDGKTYTLYTYPQNALPTSSIAARSADQPQYLTLNVKENSGLSVTPIQSRSNQYKFIGIDVSEQQPTGTSWCGAYCAAGILRSIGTATPVGHPTAADVMNIIYPNGYTSTTMTTPAQLIAAAHEYDVYPIYANYAMSTEFLISELDDVWPVYMKMKDFDYDIGHDVVLRGYDLRSSVWSIWNPWYNDRYESFPIGGTYAPASSSVYNYTYVATIYNWVYE